MKRRRLSDLYTRGTDLEIDDGTGDPVPVRLQKLNEIDREAVLRRANAAKARDLIDSDNEDSDAFQAMYARIRDFGDRDGLVSLIIAEDAFIAATAIVHHMVVVTRNVMIVGALVNNTARPASDEGAPKVVLTGAVIMAGVEVKNPKEVIA